MRASGATPAACEEILGTIEEHHGEHSHDPPLDLLEAFGVQPTPSIRDAFAAYGFDAVEARADGFVAARAAAG